MDNFRYGQEQIGDRINFSNGTPPAKYFPFEIYKKLAKQVMKECSSKLFEYQNVQGLESLRVIFFNINLYTKKLNYDIIYRKN